MGDGRGHNQGDVVYRALVTTTFEPDPDSANERDREGWTYVTAHGSYDTPGPANAAVKRALRRYPRRGETITAKPQRGVIVWEDLD